MAGCEKSCQKKLDEELAACQFSDNTYIGTWEASNGESFSISSDCQFTYYNLPGSIALKGIIESVGSYNGKIYPLFQITQNIDSSPWVKYLIGKYYTIRIFNYNSGNNSLSANLPQQTSDSIFFAFTSVNQAIEYLVYFSDDSVYYPYALYTYEKQ